MEFEELKQKISSELSIEKPDFVKDTDTNINIGFIDLTATQKLIFSLSNFRNKQYIDIRTWFQDQSGEWKPTKKGVHFNVDLFENFQTILNSLNQLMVSGS